MDNHLKRFDEIAKQICELHRKKDAAYGNSFGETYKKLGIISAVTRISDKYNRLVNLSTKTDLDNLGESIEDTLKDLAAYSIMTLVELENRSLQVQKDTPSPDKADETVVKSDDETKVTEHYQVKQKDLKGDIAGFLIEVVQRMVDCQVEQSNEANVAAFQRDKGCTCSFKGFDWDKTEEGFNFWLAVINRKNFDLFFEKYPKTNK